MTAQDALRRLLGSLRIKRQPGGRSACPRLARALLATVCAFAFDGASASAGPYNPDNLPLNQVGRIGQICRTDMRLEPFGEQYQSCVDSLMVSAKDLNRGQAMQQSRVYCTDKGLRPGQPGFAECELQSADAHPARATGSYFAAVSDADGPGGLKSYSRTSPRDVFRREQLSCARLGFDPDDSAFGSCVAGLQSSMFEADNPSQ